MDHFLYRDGVLMAEDVAVAEIAAEVGTPFYCYSTATFERHFRLFVQQFAIGSQLQTAISGICLITIFV